MKVFIILICLLILTSNAEAFQGEGVFYKEDQATKILSLPESIFVTGEITLQTPFSLSKIIRENNIKNGIVYFNSPGGNVSAGLALGKIIRNRGFYTSIGIYEKNSGRVTSTGYCYSACVFAYAGGKYRFTNEDHQLGLHRFSKEIYAPTDLASGQIISGEIVKYLKSMGVDTALFSRMVKTTKNQIDTLTSSEALDYRLSNNGFLPTAWSYQSEKDKGIIYLKGERETWMGTGKMIFTCDGTESFAMAMHTKGNLAISGDTTFKIDDQPYKVKSLTRDVNSYHTAAFTPQLGNFLAMLTASKISFVFHGANPDLAYIFDLSLEEGRKNINSYMKRCIKILSLKNSRLNKSIEDISTKIKKMNTNLPKEVEDGILATEVKIDDGVVYNYTLMKIRPKTKDFNLFLKKMPPQLKKTVCGGAMKSWMKIGLKIHFSYKDLNAAPVAIFSFKDGDCEV